MKKDIKKELDKAAHTEHPEILKRNESFLKDVLLPMVEENKQNISDEQLQTSEGTKVIRRKKAFTYSILAASLAIIFIVLTVFSLQPTEKGYLGPFDTKASDLQTINSCLVKTRLNADFGTITLTYDQKTKKPMSFATTHEVTEEETVIENKIEIIIERSLTFDFEKTDYKKNLKFLGYEVKYNETITEESFEELHIYEFNMEVYFDTGKERYFFVYYEISTNSESSFYDYLENLVKSNV